MADLTEPIERVHVEVDRAPADVCVVSIEHHADEPTNVRDRRRRARFAPAIHDFERPHVAVEPRGLGRSEVEIVHAELARLAEDVVVDVGHVANAPRCVSPIDQSTL